jgi:nucleotide-binding universal stress UspA family protein
MFDRILVPVDGSQHASRAVSMAAELAKCHGSAVYLLHVIRDLSLPKEILQMISAGEVTESRKEILRNSADIILGDARKRCEEAGVTAVKTELLMGDPASTILSYGQDNDIELLVIGHRGLGPSQGLLGGVARKLVNMSTISCLIAT